MFTLLQLFADACFMGQVAVCESMAADLGVIVHETPLTDGYVQCVTDIYDGCKDVVATRFCSIDMGATN